MVILKGNPNILKRGGGIKMWMWLCAEREICLGFRNRVGMRKIRTNIEAKKIGTSFVDEARLHGMEHPIIKMMCGRQVDKVSTEIFHDRVGIVVKIEDMIIQNSQWWYGCVLHGDINSQIHKVMEVEIIRKRKKNQARKPWEECIKKNFKQYGLRREDLYN